MKKDGVLIFAIICLIFSQFNLIAQESERIVPRLDFTYLKKTEGSRLLKANLYIVVNRQSVPIVNVPVVFTFEAEPKKVEVNTNHDGSAILLIDKDTKIIDISSGSANFTASFNGNDTLDVIFQELTIKDALIRLSFDEIDSVRTVSALLFEVIAGDILPVAEQTLNFYVPRMFSLLKIAEETTDEEGNISFEFPKDLPGQKDGTIIVVARLEENDVYANIEVRQTVKWGIPLVNPVPESHRTLWTEVAPLWMIVTLSIMLIGVWGHYIYTIIQLILIRKDGLKTKA